MKFYSRPDQETGGRGETPVWGHSPRPPYPDECVALLSYSYG
ncbi:MAG TPA: hypothetical protein V6C57_16930 [Coleofasciculaceae cyanobacterium]